MLEIYVSKSGPKKEWLPTTKGWGGGPAQSKVYAVVEDEVELTISAALHTIATEEGVFDEYYRDQFVVSVNRILVILLDNYYFSINFSV